MKRTIAFLVIWLIFAVCAEAQEYRVMAVTDGVQSTIMNRQIKGLDAVKASDVLFIPIAGYVALVDDKANVFEFYGEKTVRLDSLHGASLRTFSAMPIERLYSTTMPIHSIHNDIPVEIFYPFLFSNDLEVVDSVRIKWIGRFSFHEGFTVKLITVFDDFIYQGETSEKELLIRLPKDKVKNQELIVIVGPSPLKFKKGNVVVGDSRQLTVVGKKGNDVTSNDQTAAGNLALALFWETKGSREALIYYQRASEIASTVPAYKTFLANFKTRSSL